MSIAGSGEHLPFYVYILQCEDRSFYTGYCKNLKSRVNSHIKGKGARYTRIHRAKKLVYSEEFATRIEAMRRERRIKRLSHDQKARLARLPLRQKHR